VNEVNRAVSKGHCLSFEANQIWRNLSINDNGSKKARTALTSRMALERNHAVGNKTKKRLKKQFDRSQLIESDQPCRWLGAITVFNRHKSFNQT